MPDAPTLPFTIGPFVISQTPAGDLAITVTKADGSALETIQINHNGGVNVGDPNT